MLIDARTYQLQPNRLADFLADYPRLGLPVQRRHGGRLMGYFTTISGVLNQVVHYWQYENAGERESVRKAFSADPDWAKYTATNPGRFVRQDTQFLVPVPFLPMGNDALPQHAAPGIYEERSYHLRATAAEYVEVFRTTSLTMLRGSGVDVLGLFTVDTGTLNRIVHVWRWNSLSERMRVMASWATLPGWPELRKANAPRSLYQHVRLMVPTDFSPMQ